MHNFDMAISSGLSLGFIEERSYKIKSVSVDKNENYKIKNIEQDWCL